MSRAVQLESLLDRVRSMRRAQTVYFLNRTAENLNLAKMAERLVDKAIAELDSPQVGMFESTP